MKDIKMVDLHSQYLNIKSDIDTAMQNVIETSSFINGKDVTFFADELANFLEVKHVIPCANGTDALQIALMALDLPLGSEIIVPTFNYVATAEVIALLGFKPIFIDANLDNFNLLIGAIEPLITENTKAIMPVHLFGQCADMLSILKIAQMYNLYVIEDAAQAIGANYSFPDDTYKKAGTIGHIGTTSFFPSKNLGCMGDGGAIFTNDDDFAAKIKTLANHGQKSKYYYDLVGVNSRLDTLQAAILRVKLKQLNNYTASRQKAANKYDSLLAKCSEVVTPKRVINSDHVFHQYTIKVPAEKRDDLKNYLQSKNIPSMIYYPKALHEHKAYEYLLNKSEDLPNSVKLSQEVLSLPMHTELEFEQISYICENIISFFQQ